MKIGCLGRYPSFFYVCFLSFFFCPNKRKTKQKENSPSAFFYLLQSFSPLNKKNSLALKQLFVFNAPKSTSASRQKNEAGSFWGGCGINVASLVIGYLLDVSMKKLTLESCTSNSEAHLSPPLEDRHLVEGVKKIGRISVKNKKLFER